MSDFCVLYITSVLAHFGMLNLRNLHCGGSTNRHFLKSHTDFSWNDILNAYTLLHEVVSCFVLIVIL